MKKILFISIFFCLSFPFFAASDLTIALLPAITTTDYTFGNKHYHKAGYDKISFNFVNYNFINEKENLGFFESLNFALSNTGIDVLAGPAYRVDLDFVNINFGAAVHFLWNSDLYKMEDSNKITLICLGGGFDIRVKFSANRRCSPVLGVSFSYDPFCRVISETTLNGEVVGSGSNYSNYSRVSYMPYAAFGINF